MNANYERAYYDFVMILCAVMTIFNLLRWKSRGLSATFLGSAFLVLGVTAYAYSRGYASGWITAGGVIVFGLLAADVVYRTANPGKLGAKTYPGRKKP
jgi:hypothetical protein